MVDFRKQKGFQPRHKRRVAIAIVSIVIVLLAAAGSLVAAQYFFEPPKEASQNQPENTKPDAPVKTALSCVMELPANTLFGQKLMAAGYSDQLASLQSDFWQSGVGGMIIMNEIPAETLAAFSKGFAIAPIIAVDQEGGTVQRYKSQGIVPGAAEMAADYTAAQAYSEYLKDAQFLKSLGITTNFAPVLGVISAPVNPLPDRMYSSNPDTVVTYATQFITASQKAGVTPVVKHFPGLGSATGNTDLVSAKTDPLSVLKTRDVLPYQKLAQYKTDAMVANVIVPELTNGQPAVWSPEAVALLRSYGYENAVVYSDSLTAEAIPGALDDAAVKAWQAGIDVALIVQEREDSATLAALFASIMTKGNAALENGNLDKTKLAESVLRILQRKGVDACSI